MRNLLNVTALLSALALVGAAVAVAAGGHTARPVAAPPRSPETPLTGDTLTQASAAAIAAVGGTVDAATTDNDPQNANARYEVHVTKTDGTHVTVVLDASYAVVAVHAGHGPCPRGMHGGPGNGETPLTGDVATQAKAAAVAKVGGTADHASTETDGTLSGAAYEVHVTKADGTHVEVVLDKAYTVLAVNAGGPGPRPGGRP